MPEGFTRQSVAGVSYVEAGQGEPLLLIHGVGLNAEAWAPQIKALSSTHRVIAMDLPGHGGSAAPPAGADLSHYVAAVCALLDGLNIPACNVAGHSMGGLVATGLALAHPGRVLRLGVFNAVYRRSAEAREAVEARAREIAARGDKGDLEGPLTRWFGAEDTDARRATRAMLAAVDAGSYAIAYGIFARGDEIHAGRLGALSMPALFATGELDPNSTPAMAEAMAAEAPRGKALVIAGQRHMMNLADPASSTAALRNLLAEPLQAVDVRSLRSAFGSFMTGVTIVTTIDGDGNPRGFTANSFTSVSLDPPLLLICIGKSAASYVTFSRAPGFAVNILAEQQKETSGIFASKRPDKFASVAWHKSPRGNPLIDGSLAWFDCARHEIIDAGDHIIVLGAISSHHHTEGNPLGYARGGYVSLGLEQAAVNAVSAGRTVVGAILECGGQLVLEHDAASGIYRLPEVGRSGVSGSASLLADRLGRSGVAFDLGFLFAVFENPETKVQSIYYRGEAEQVPAGAALQLTAFDAIPWEHLEDEAVCIMLRRYAAERQQGRFKIYSGDHRRGEVKALHEQGEGP
jgi:flavin reductase (DIM6/NTAB) family NADH-FMN oxidoreductase RutF/pimeloyl-ACP methyl ester carboxylesterase